MATYAETVERCVCVICRIINTNKMQSYAFCIVILYFPWKIAIFHKIWYENTIFLPKNQVYNPQVCLAKWKILFKNLKHAAVTF